MTEYDPNAPIGAIQDPDDPTKPLTRARALELLDATLTDVKDFVVAGHEHWEANHDIQHIVTGLAALHDHTHYLTNALLVLAEHDAKEDAIEEQIVAVVVPDVVPQDWTS